MKIQKIGIIGLGLIGGSLAKAFKRKTNIKEIIAFDKNEDYLLDAMKDKVIDNYTLEISNIFLDCEIVFICTPVNTITYYVKKIIPFINKDCIITDVGSAKNQIFKELENIDNINFIGGHPMAGSEKTGYFASNYYLFENAYYVLTPNKNITDEKFIVLENLIKELGAIPIKFNPKSHDFAVAAISHLPHIVASALVNCVKRIDDQDKSMRLLAAGGFKDITRIASASPELWNSICMENKTDILKVLDEFKKELIFFEEDFNHEDTIGFFDEAKKYRDEFSETKRSGYFSIFDLKVDVLDKPGSIATVATMLSVNGINIKNIGIINNRDFTDGFMRVEFDNQSNMDKAKKLLEEMNFNVY